jgi:tetratricopeptide (TPR) repeat protein
MSDLSATDDVTSASGSDSWKARIQRVVVALTPIWGTAITLILVSLAVVAIYGTQSWYQAVLAITLVSYFPISYITYVQFRAEIHKQRVKDDFRLLGLASEEAQLDVRYRQIYSPWQFVIYVSLAAMTTLLGFGLLHFRVDLSFVSETTSLLMFHSFLGAYVFSIYYVYRRYSTLDLQPVVYLYVTVQMITVQAVAFVAAQQLQVEAGSLPALIPVVAFVIGYIPGVGTGWLTATAGRLIGRFVKRKERQLSDVDGISLWHEARLRESGLDNVQNLAAADVRELLLSSRFSAQQLMHWVDQAIFLIANLPQEKYDALAKRGVFTISAFRRVWEMMGGEDWPELKELRALYYAAETGPNLHYVTQYWSAMQEYQKEIVTRGLETLLERLRDQAVQVARALADVPVEQLGGAMFELGFAPQEVEALFRGKPESLLGLGRVYIQRELYDDAVRVLDQAIRADSRSVAAYSYRGLAYAMQGNYDRAFSDFRRARDLDPGDAITLNHEGRTYILQENYRQAITALSLAIELDPEYALAYYNRGFAWRRLGQLDEAIADFDHVLDYDERFYLAYFERGLTYLSLGAYVDAIRDFDEAIRIDYSEAQAHSNRGVAYMGLGDYRRAIYDLDTAIGFLDAAIKRKPDLGPNLAAAYSNRGQARLELGDIMGAIDDFTYALRLDGTLAQAYKNRALAHTRRNALPEALADFEHYLDLQPEAPDADDVRELIERLRQQAPTD